jgi:hypothetical protein
VAKSDQNTHTSRLQGIAAAPPRPLPRLRRPSAPRARAPPPRHSARTPTTTRASCQASSCRATTWRAGAATAKRRSPPSARRADVHASAPVRRVCVRPTPLSPHAPPPAAAGGTLAPGTGGARAARARTRPWCACACACANEQRSFVARHCCAALSPNHPPPRGRNAARSRSRTPAVCRQQQQRRRGRGRALARRAAGAKHDTRGMLTRAAHAACASWGALARARRDAPRARARAHTAERVPPHTAVRTPPSRVPCAPPCAHLAAARTSSTPAFVGVGRACRALIILHEA